MMLRKILFTITISLLAISGIAQAQCLQRIELCLAIDGSGSIDPSDFYLQKEGLALAVEDPSVVPQNGTATISVVQFSSSAVTEVTSTVIDSQTTADNVAAQIRSISQMDSLTNFAAAIDACMNEFTDPNSKWTIDISTDGRMTAGSDPIVGRENAVAGGLDTLNTLGVGSGIDQSFLEDLVWPQPATLAPPFDDGFVVLVDDFDEYVQAVSEKMGFELCPEDCGNLVDDDQDGLVDKDDPDCWVCGDDYLDPDEECDDGNNLDGDGCSAVCEFEEGPNACFLTNLMIIKIRKGAKDFIRADGSFLLADDAVYDLDIDDVTFQIDDYIIIIPAGSFKWKKSRYEYEGTLSDGTYVSTRLEFTTRKHKWHLYVKKNESVGNITGIDNSDGVDVNLTIGDDVVTENIAMNEGVQPSHRKLTYYNKKATCKP